MADAVEPDSELLAVINAADSVLWKYRDQQPQPSMLFQYTSLEAALQIIETRTVWCSNLRYSNDPSEATYGKDLLDDIMTKDTDLKLEGLRKVIAELDPYAASFSADDDLLPQWRAYCRNGRGVAIGASFETLRDNKSMIFVRVVYDPAEQRRFITDMLNVFRTSLLSARHDQTRLAAILHKLALYLATIRSALKSNAYDSEKEYRLLNLLPNRLDEPHSGLNFRVSGGSIVPFLSADLSQSRHGNIPEPIRSVRLGPCLDASLVEASLRLFGDQTGRTLQVTRSKVSMRCE